MIFFISCTCARRIPYFFPNLYIMVPLLNTRTREASHVCFLKRLLNRNRRKSTAKSEAGREAPNRWQYDQMYRAYMSKPSPRLIPWRVSGPNKQMMDVFVTMGVNPPVSVMDLGCGAGKNAKYLSERGFNVVGVDFSVETLKLARTLKVTSPPARDRIW